LSSVFGPDTYRFCELICDTIKTVVDFGCGAAAGGMSFMRHWSCRALWAAGWWQMRHAFQFFSG